MMFLAEVKDTATDEATTAPSPTKEISPTTQRLIEALKGEMRKGRDLAASVLLEIGRPAVPSTSSRVGQHSWQGVDALSDLNYNIRLGVSYLQYLSRKFRGNREHMLIAYNWGPGNLLSALKKQGSPPSSTVRYARTIMSDHARWADDFRQRRAQLRHMKLGNLLG